MEARLIEWNIIGFPVKVIDLCRMVVGASRLLLARFSLQHPLLFEPCRSLSLVSDAEESSFSVLHWYYRDGKHCNSKPGGLFASSQDRSHVNRWILKQSLAAFLRYLRQLSLTVTNNNNIATSKQLGFYLIVISLDIIIIITIIILQYCTQCGRG